MSERHYYGNTLRGDVPLRNKLAGLLAESDRQGFYGLLEDDARNKLAREMAHSYQGNANAPGPLNFIAERFKPDFYSNRANELAGLISQMSLRDLPPVDMNTLKSSQMADPEGRQRVLDAINAFGPQNLGGFGAITAYHGSPHKFDKFKMDKIGTGEGAQAYGHGLYFAESPEVAKWYSGKVNTMKSPSQSLADYAMDGQSKSDAIKYLRDNRDLMKRMGKTEAYNNHAEALRIVKSGSHNPDYSNLYKVDISDNAVKNFLDWDKPLSQQPESVRNALAPHIEAATTGVQFSAKRMQDGSFSPVYESDSIPQRVIRGKSFRDYDAAKAAARAEFEKSVDGQRIIAGLLKEHGNPEQVSSYLKSLGIPGIRYLDQGSRGAGKGTSNFVVFDEDIVKILERK